MPAPASQLPPELTSFLDPGTYRHPVTAVELRETHISWLFLAGEYVYKLKKPVDLGFVDFTRRERRRFFCHEEIRLNRRLEPDLYLEVWPLMLVQDAAGQHCGRLAFAPQPDVADFACGQSDHHDSSPAESTALGSTAVDYGPQDSEAVLSAEPEPVEYAVRMRRFPDDALLSQSAAQQQLTSRHFREFAARIFEFHSAAAVAPADSDWGSPDSVLRIVTDNFVPIAAGLELVKQTASASDSADTSGFLPWLRREIEALYVPLESLLARRQRERKIRECHGDLHLNNLFLADDRIHAFDCIEFSEAFRWIDPVNEIAFLTMDLKDRGLDHFAHVFLAEYVQQTGDFAALLLLRFYEIYRALVRAKVQALQLQQAVGSDSVSSAAEPFVRELNRYLELTERLLKPASPCLFLTHGVSGTGKSTCAARIVEIAGAIWLRSDRERQRLFPESSAQTGAAVEPDRYTAAAIDQVYQHLAHSARTVLAAGYSVIVDATFLLQSQRAPFFELAQEFGCPFSILSLDAADDILAKRISQRSARPDNVSEATVQVLAGQRHASEPFTAAELPHVHPLKGSDDPVLDRLCS